MTKNELKGKLNTLLEYFKQHTDDVKAQKELEQHIANLDSKQYKVAVVANMSAGKSTFINALLGEDILPTSTKATTDCATYIYPREGKREAKIYFSDHDGRAPEILGEDRLKELWEYAKKDEDCEDPKHKNVDQIDLYYPFKLLSTSGENTEFEIVFIDTPGPNSKGGDYAEKHKDATRRVLNEVNLALYLLDYGQLDALFDNDKQGLWHTIGERKEKDEYFDVFFVINKIDLALKNLQQEIDTIDDDDEYTRAKKERWGKYEQEAIQKVADQVKEHFDLRNREVKVFSVSSMNQILHSRQQDLGRIARQDYEKFKSWFDGFADKEKAMIDYIGFESLENEIRYFIQKEAQNSIIKPFLNIVQNAINEIGRDIQTNLESLSQPQKEAEENIKRGKQFLEKGYNTLQENMTREIENIQQKAQDEIIATFDSMMQICKDGIPDCVIRAMIFLLDYAEGNSLEKSRQASIRTFKNEDIRSQAMKAQSIIFAKTRSENDIQEQMNAYIVEMLNDIRRDLLDMQIDVKQIYDKLNGRYMECLNRYKAEINRELGQNLGVEFKEVQIHDVHINLSFGMDFLSGNIAFIHEEAKYKTIDNSAFYKPWTWIGDWTERVKVEDEKNYVNIDPNLLRKNIEKTILHDLDNIAKIAKIKHTDNIQSQGSITYTLLSEFVEKQTENIEKLEKNRAEIEKSKRAYEAKYKAFQDMCSKIDMKDEGK